MSAIYELLSYSSPKAQERPVTWVERACYEILWNVLLVAGLLLRSSWLIGGAIMVMLLLALTSHRSR